MQLVNDRLTPPSTDYFSSRTLSARSTPLSPLNPHRHAANWATPPSAMDEDLVMMHSQASHQTSSPSPPPSSPTPFAFNAIAGPSRLAYAAQPMSPVPGASHAKAFRRRQSGGDAPVPAQTAISFAGKRSQAVPALPRSTSYDPSVRLQSARPLQKWRRPNSLEPDVYSRKSGTSAVDGGGSSDSVQDALWNRKLSQRVHRKGDRERVRRKAPDGMDDAEEDPAALDAEDEEVGRHSRRHNDLLIALLPPQQLFSHLIAMQHRKAQRQALAAFDREMNMSDPDVMDAAIREAERSGAGPGSDRVDPLSPEEEEMLRMLAAEEEMMGPELDKTGGRDNLRSAQDAMDDVDPSAVFDVDDDIDMQ